MDIFESNVGNRPVRVMNIDGETYLQLPIALVHYSISEIGIMLRMSPSLATAIKNLLITMESSLEQP